MCFGGNLGVIIDLSKIQTSLDKDYQILFSESNTRFVVEVNNCQEFEKWMEDVPINRIGLIKGEKLIIKGLSENIVVEEKISDLKVVWKKPLAW